MSSGGVDPEEDRYLSDRSIAIELFTRVQIKVQREIALALAKSGVESCLLKGTALRSIVYENPEHRAGIDIDIAIRPQTARISREIVSQLGFVQSAWDPHRRTFVKATEEQRRWVEENHYELGFLIRRHEVTDFLPMAEEAILRQLHIQPNPWHISASGKLCLWINVDLHTGISHDIGLDEAFATSIAWNNDDAMRIPALSWLLFNVIFKLYWEGVFSYGKGLYQYADICRILPHLDGDDLDLFLELVTRYRLESAAYFVLRRLESQFDTTLPYRLQVFIKEAQFAPYDISPQQENNMGDVWAKLWNFR